MNMHARDDSPLVEELSDRELRKRAERAAKTIREIERSDNREILRSGKADETLARYEAAIDQADEVRQELRSREHHEIGRRLPLLKQLRDSKRQQHPALTPLQHATKMSFPELKDARLVADRLSPEQADELSELL